MFKIKDGYNSFRNAWNNEIVWHRKKYNNKTKNGENVPRLEVVGVFLVQCNLIHNRYQQKTDALYIFMSNKCYGYMLNVDWCNLISFENI